MNNTIWSKFHLVTFLWLRFSNSQSQIQSCGPGPSPAPRHPCNVHFWANGVKQWPQTMVKLADPVDPLGPWGPVFVDHRVQRKRPLCSCPWNGQRDSFFQVRSVSSPVAWQSMTNSTHPQTRKFLKHKKIRGQCNSQNNSQDGHLTPQQMGALNGHLLPHWPQPVLPGKQRSPTWAAPLHLQRSPPFWSHNPECFWAPKWMIQPNLSFNGGMPHFYITEDTLKECISMKIWRTRCYCCHCSDGIDSLGAHLKHWWRSSKRLTHGTSGSHMLWSPFLSLSAGEPYNLNIYNMIMTKIFKLSWTHFSWGKLSISNQICLQILLALKA